MSNDDNIEEEHHVNPKWAENPVDDGTPKRKSPRALMHVPTPEQRQFVRDHVRRGTALSEIYKELGITRTTFNKRYADIIATRVKPGVGGPAHVKTDEMRETVLNYVMLGLTVVEIAKRVGIGKQTLYRRYRDELDFGRDLVNQEVVGHLLGKIRNGDTQATIFWMKAKAGWKETSGLDLGNPDGSLRPTSIRIIPASTVLKEKEKAEEKAAKLRHDRQALRQAEDENIKRIEDNRSENR